MQTVSNGWIANQQEYITSQSLIDIWYKGNNYDGLLGVTWDSSPTKAYGSVSNLSKDYTKNGDRRYITFEGGLLSPTWVTDGSFVALSEDEVNGTQETTDIYFVSDAISLAPDGLFRGEKPYIESSDMAGAIDGDSSGLTIIFSPAFNEYATDFNLDMTYEEESGGESRTLSLHVTNNEDVVWTYPLTFYSISSLRLQINNWSHVYSTAKVAGIYSSILFHFTADDISSYSMDYSVDPLATNLPTKEMKFTIIDTEAKFNPLNPNSYYGALEKKATVSSKYGYIINGVPEWIAGDTCWLTSWETPQNGLTVTFTANGATSFINTVDYPYKKNPTLTVAQFFQDNFSALLPNTFSRLALSDGTISSVIFAYVTETTPLSEIFQAYCNYHGLSIIESRDGTTISLKTTTTVLGQPVDNTYTIDEFNSYKRGEISLLAQPKSINVNGTSYSTGFTDGAEEVSITNGIADTSSTAKQAIANRCIEVFAYRATAKGEFRADPRLDVMDMVGIKNRFTSEVKPLLITTIKYTYSGGAFKGSYTGRVIE